MKPRAHLNNSNSWCEFESSPQLADGASRDCYFILFSACNFNFFPHQVHVCWLQEALLHKYILSDNYYTLRVVNLVNEA